MKRHEVYSTYDSCLFALDSETVIAFSPTSGCSAILSTEHARIFSMCSQWAELSSAASKVSSDLGQTLAQIRPIIDGFVNSGLLVNKQSIVETFHSSESASLRLEKVFIPTRGRPGSLGLALDGYCDHFTRFDRHPAFLIVDDTEDPAENAACLRKVAKRYGSSILHADRSSRSNLAGRIADRVGISRSVVEFALLGDSHLSRFDLGSARNTALLAFSNSPFLSTDDDVRCQFFDSHKEQATALHIRTWSPSQSDICEHQFFSSLDQALSGRTHAHLDMMNLHERVLGKSLTDLACRSQKLTLSMTSEHVGRVRRRAATVLLSGMGLVGDCAADGAGYFALLRDQRSISNLTSRPSMFQDLMAARQIAAGVPELTLWDGPVWRGINMAIDNRRLLPPFLPIGRVDDHLYGHLMKHCVPGYLCAIQPFMIVHSPPESRRTDEWWRGLNLLEYHNVIQLLLHLNPLTSLTGSPATQMELIGRNLLAWCEIGPRDFAKYLYPHFVRGGCNVAEIVEKRISEFQSEPLVTDTLKTFRLHVIDQVRAIPTPECKHDVEFWQRIQKICGKFGELLASWPAISEVAQTFAIDNMGFKSL